MTYHSSTLSRIRAVGLAQPSARCAATAVAPSAVDRARASTSLAMSIMVALRYLEGRPSRSAAAAAAVVAAPVLT